MVNFDKSKSIEKIEKVEGTVYYYAPEMCKYDDNNTFDPFPLDIWALGITLYCMIYLELPYKISNEEKNDITLLLNKISKGVVLNESKHKRNISKGLHNLLSILLNPNPKERPTSKELINNEWLNEGREKLYLEKTEIIKVSDEEIERSIDFFYSNAKNRNYELLWKPRAYMTGSSLLNPLTKGVSNKSINIGQESNKSINKENKDEVEMKNNKYEENLSFGKNKSKASLDSFYFYNKQISIKDKKFNEEDFFDN